MFAWLGQLRALWDLSGQLVELRELVEQTRGELNDLAQQLNTINERTRKQDYRARKEAEDTAWRAPQTAAVPEGGRAALLRAARAKGLPT